MRIVAFTWPDLVYLHPDVPIRGLQLEREHNGVPYLQGELDEATARTPATVEGSSGIIDGHLRTGATVPLIRQHGTLLVALAANHRPRSFVVKTNPQDFIEQDTLAILAEGLEGLPYGTPWDGAAMAYVREDPLLIHRDIWEHITSYPDVADVKVQEAESPVRVGDEEQTNEGFERSDGTVVEAFDYGPFRLRSWAEHDLGRIIDQLAEETPFEHRVVTIFDPESQQPPRFRVERAYPGFESHVLKHLRFEVGHNVGVPEEDDDEARDYYSHVIVWGNGDGSRRCRGEAHRLAHDRGRKVLVVEDQGLTSDSQCRARARTLLGRSKATRFYDRITVTNSEAAPLGSFDIGDVITLQSPQLDGNLHVQQGRIIRLEHDVEADQQSLRLEPVTEEV